MYIAFSSNECSGEPVQMHRLARAFAASRDKVMMAVYKDSNQFKTSIDTG